MDYSCSSADGPLGRKRKPPSEITSATKSNYTSCLNFHTGSVRTYCVLNKLAPSAKLARQHGLHYAGRGEGVTVVESMRTLKRQG